VSRKAKDSGFWPSVLEGLAGVRLKKEEADRAEKCVQEVTGWNDPVEEKTGFVEAACQNYEVLLEEKRAGRGGGAGPLQRHETRIGEKQRDVGTSGGPEKSRKPSFRMTMEIEKTTDVRRVLEERILDSRVELHSEKCLASSRRRSTIPSWT
jgi:hypothetical protein